MILENDNPYNKPNTNEQNEAGLPTPHPTADLENCRRRQSI